MRIGILGAGLMGGKLGTIFPRAGHEVVFSYARSYEKLKKLARDAKGDARAGTPSEAAKEADAVLLAVHWSRIDEVLKQSGDLLGKVMLTCCLPMDSGQHETDRWNDHVGSRRTGQEGSQGSCRLRVQHRAQRGAVRRLRGKKQEIPAEPGVLR
jgi:predicted dinucleotide-binding enzyme